MTKKLSEMTLEELWQLFPIILREHNPCWAEWYREEREVLSAMLPGARLSHIGSTAVPGIWAKPTVDILVEIDLDIDMHSVKQLLEDNGYTYMNGDNSRMSFNKGYTESGFAERVFHLHLRYKGDHDELYFRDYLIAHPDAAKEYEQLKLSLWKQYEHDRDGYTERKTEFVKKYTALAKEEL